MSAAIRTQALTKDYGGGRGVFALDLEVAPGEIVGFLGPNGAGKSTTMRMLLGLIAPSSGRAEVLGGEVTAAPVRRRIGYLPGDFTLHPGLTGAQVLAHFARLQGGVPARRITELADRLGAELRRPVGELSTGNRQKLGLIQALMHEPDLLVLDEPIAGLDPLVQHSFHDLLAERRAEGAAVFLSSHTLAEVDRVADRVAVLRAGRLVVVDTLDHLRAIAVRRWEVELGAPVDPETLRGVENVTAVEGDAGRLVISFRGTPDALVKALAGHEVHDLRPYDDDLEQVFLRFYAEEA